MNLRDLARMLSEIVSDLDVVVNSTSIILTQAKTRLEENVIALDSLLQEEHILEIANAMELVEKTLEFKDVQDSKKVVVLVEEQKV